MQTFSAQIAPWFAASGIVLCALSVVPGELSFRQVAFASQTQAPSPQGADVVPSSPACPLPGSLPGSLPPAADAASCVHTIVAGDTLGSIATQYATTPDALLRANRKTRVRGQKTVTNRNVLTAGALLLIPTPPVTPSESEELPVPSHAQAPPVSADENIVRAIADLKEGQAELQADTRQQGRQIDDLTDMQQRQGMQLDQLGQDMAMLQSSLEQLTHRLAAFQNAFENILSLVKTGALVAAGVCILAIIGMFLLRGYPGHPPRTLPPKAAREESARMDIHIATRYLSAPKSEDVILTASAPHRYALVLADGASSLACSGREISGGGRGAAQIAAHTALTYLTGQLLPVLSIEEMVALLQGCFRQAQTALEKHNASTTTPGGTTLLIALLCQAGDGRWYWLHGNLGNGVLALLHSAQLLSGWPIHTPLLTKQSDGNTTITLPGHETHGYRPSVGVRPHHPGDILVMGSDGLDHLNTVTMKCDRLYFLNYLWKHIQDEPAGLQRSLQGLQKGRTDAPWQNALALDDTTIGILWA